jgi:hypothetical protein
MAKLTPELEARYALEWGLRREDLPEGVQAEYDRQRRIWGAAETPAVVEAGARVRAEQAEYDRLRLDWLRELRDHAGGPVPEPGPVAGPGGHVRRVSGDRVRNTGFLPGYWGGYDEPRVDYLLRLLAAELDAGRPVEPLVRRAKFTLTRSESSGYDIAAVDWFVEELLREEYQPEPGRLGTDPWCDLPVANQVTWPGPGGPGERSGDLRRQARRYLKEQCGREWCDFGLLPGTHLWESKVGWSASHRELCTSDQQTLAEVRPKAVSAGGRNFTLKDVHWKRYSDPVIAEIAARAVLDSAGHFDADTGRKIQQMQWLPHQNVTALIDEAGAPILYTTELAVAYTWMRGITFPDQRRLRFRIRGPGFNNIMTAVDQAGNRIARYRVTGKGRTRKTDITVNPSRNLTDELVLAIAISAPWLADYHAPHPVRGAG